MKYNLIFGGIEQTALDYEEETTTSMRSNLWLIMFIVETSISIEIFGRRSKMADEVGGICHK
jgi:hypothetical protein